LTTILIAADPADNVFWDPISSVLQQRYSTLLVRGKQVTVPQQPARVALLDAGGYAHLQSAETVVLFRRTRSISQGLLPPENCVAVVDSCDDELLRFVSGTRVPAITCGLSARDTMTLSSMGEDSAVLNLQRSVTCFDGAVADPQEIPVKLTRSINSYTLMALACTFILCGDIAGLAGLKI